MRILDHQNAASSKITVTNTATLLYSLINTAGSVTNSQAYFEALFASGLMITPEDGDIRMMVGQTPTSALGMFLKQGTKYYFPLLDLARLKLIRVTGNVACSVELYIADPNDVFAAVGAGGGGSSETTDTDDDSIAKGQTLPLKINENYIFSKTGDAWIRQQGTSDGYAFGTTIGIYTPAGDLAMDDTKNSVVVSSVDLDIRDLTKASDSVKAELTGLDVSAGVYKEPNVIDTGTYNSLFTTVIDPSGVPMTILDSGADGLSNTHNQAISASWLYGYNGATWDRVPATAADGILVNLGTNNDVTVTGSVTASVTFPTDYPLPAAQVVTLTPPPAITNFALETGGHLASIDGKMVSGTDIGDVTVNNASGVNAVNIQDGGNTITVDGTVGVSSLPAIPLPTGAATEVTLADLYNILLYTLDRLEYGTQTSPGKKLNLGTVDTVSTVTSITGFGASASVIVSNTQNVNGVPSFRQTEAMADAAYGIGILSNLVTT